MTRRATGPRRGIPRIWLIPILGLTTLLAATALGVLSRSLLLDLLAWWPVWAAILLLAVLARGRSVRRVRLSGLVPLAATLAVAMFAIAHMQGWPGMPSDSVRLVGPVVGGAETAEMSARLDGQLRVGAGSSFLYVVEPVRRGGEIAVPEAVERSTGTAVKVVLGPPGDPGFYGFAGWDISLSDSPAWTLALEGEIDADLTGLDVVAAQISGTGRIRIDPVDVEVLVLLNGDFTLVVEPGSVVRVLGDATVPDSWDRLLDGWGSPGGGVGWVFDVSEASSLVITEG